MAGRTENRNELKKTKPDQVKVPAQRESQAQEKVPECCRRTQRSEDDKKNLLRRLAIIEGQVRGIRGMLEEDAYCVDILTQVSAANCALNSFSKELLARHIRTCVADDIRSGSDEKLDELVKTLPRLMK